MANTSSDDLGTEMSKAAEKVADEAEAFAQAQEAWLAVNAEVDGVKLVAEVSKAFSIQARLFGNALHVFGTDLEAWANSFDEDRDDGS